MKRITVLLGLISGLALAGCGHSAATNVALNTNPTSRKAMPPAQTAAATKPASATTSPFTWQDLHFSYDDAGLTGDDRKELAAAGAFLMKTSGAVEVEGNCDERGSVEYNLALGERRANAAKDYLVNYGISPGRITTVSYGKEKPLDPGHDEAAWAKNRRDHFVELKPKS